MLRATSVYPDGETKAPSKSTPTRPERRGVSRKTLIELLLKKREKEGTRPGAPADRKGPEHDPAKISISQ